MVDGLGVPSSPYKFAENPVFRRPVDDEMSIVISSSVIKTPDCSKVFAGAGDASKESVFDSTASIFTGTKSSVGVS